MTSLRAGGVLGAGLLVALEACVPFGRLEPRDDSSVFAEDEARPLSRYCSDPTGERVTLKVMTMNLRHDNDQWERRMPLVAEEIVRLDPDVVGVQEVALFADQIPRLTAEIAARRPDKRSPYRVYQRHKSGTAFFSGEGEAVLSKLSIEGTETRSLGYGRIVQAVRLRHGNARIDVLNTHLHAEAGDAGERIRTDQVASILDFSKDIDDCYVQFLTGDLNTVETSPIILQLRTAGFVDSFASMHAENHRARGATSPVRLQDGAFRQKPRHRIDYVFARSRLGRSIEVRDSVVAFRNHDVKGFYPSDHFGVMSTFDLSL